ncbi:MAG: ribonuclease HII [Lachnospiraceae bacterium]|nr:ribonuclease HII [Lachnospiraceae bacterium]
MAAKFNLEKELARLEGMKLYENKYSELTYICGIDEAGRGPLAGPVVAAACILPKDATILFLNDSKKLSEKRRENLFDEIKAKAFSYGIGIVSEKDIDELNILQATYKAMRIAVSQLSVTPDILLNDAVRIPELDLRQVPIVKGDAKSVSIAAASVLAKVTRDRMMLEYDEQYPGYGFARHKGYGTAEHINAIKTIGPCEIHRRTFIKNFVSD